MNMSIKAQELSQFKVSEIKKSEEIPHNFEAIKEAIGDAQIVFLGEQSHYDGATFKARIALTKYLHEELGFDIIAFEAGMYDMDKANREIKSGKKAKDVLSLDNFSNLMGVWLETEEFQEFVHFVDTTKNLDLAGFDCQITSDYSFENLAPELKEFTFLDNKYRWSSKNEDLFVQTIAELDRGSFKTFSSEDSLSINNFLTKLDNKLINLEGKYPKKAKFWRQWVKSTQAMLLYTIKETQGHKYRGQNPRAAQMADNLIYLSQKYPNKKIIAWAASFHLSNKMTSLDLENEISNQYLKEMSKEDTVNTTPTLNKLLSGAIPMGEIYKSKLGNKIYSIGFTAYEGKSGYNTADSAWITPVLTPPQNSIEDHIRKTNSVQAFVDLQQNESQATYFASIFGYVPVKGRWSELFDGVYYIQTMKPSTPYQVKIDSSKINQEKGNFITISGKIQDQKTGDALPYVNVWIKGTSIGVASNNKGLFKISIPEENSKGDLVFSSIGYKSFSLPVSSLKKEENLSIKLKASVHTLAEIVIEEPLTEQEIITKALENIESNYPQFPYSMEFFYRNKKKNDDKEIAFMDEAAFDFYDNEGYKKGAWAQLMHKKFSKLIQVRKKRDKSTEKLYSALNEIWTTWSNDPILSRDNLLSEGRVKNYDLKLKGIEDYKDRQVYHIQFDCRKPNAYNVPYTSAVFYKGSVFIDTENFAVLKYEAHTQQKTDKEKRKRVLKYYNLKESMNRTIKIHDIYYYDEFEGKYYLKYATTNKSVQFESLDKKEKKIFEDIKQVLVTKIEAKNPKVLTESNYAEPEFDEEFWETYNVILDEDF